MNGPFTTFYDFCKRMQGRDLNRRAVESLIRCGAFDGLGNNRREMLMAVGRCSISWRTTNAAT